MADARPDRLHQEPHRLAATRQQTLDAQHVRRLGRGGDPLAIASGSPISGNAHDKAVEIVVVVIELVVVMRLAALDVGLGADAQPEQRRRIDLAARTR